jgi:hypothetical protein
MIGCLTLPFRLLGLALIVLLVAAGWLYRDRIVDEVGRLSRSEQPAAAGEPSEAALRSARAKLGAIGRSAGDSVVLDAAESASLLVAGLEPALRERLDSLTVRLGRGRISVSGLVEIGRLPADVVGPLSMVLRDRERVTIGGPLAFAGPEQARWSIDQLEVRGVPVPSDLVQRVLRRAFGDDADASVVVRVPSAVQAVRIEPQQIILYRSPRP